MVKKIIFFIGICFLVVLAVFLTNRFSLRKKVQAVSTDNVIGWAWSENIGWISMNCYNDFDGDGDLETHITNPNCVNSNYGVNIDTISGPVAGEAWSENIGWIQFDVSGPYPAAPNNSVRYNPANKELSGWAKILNLSDNGWMKLQGPAAAAPANYVLCRNCIGSNCNFCYELSANGGSGRMGTACSSCAGAPPSCGSCGNVYQYGVSALPYTIKNIGVRYGLEGWAWNGENNTIISERPVGWIHFNYVYANPPLAFDNFVVVPSQTTPPSACKGADLRWETASWANNYEIKRSDANVSSQDCLAVSYPNSFFADPFVCDSVNCSYQDSSLSENRYYCYEILALNDTGSTVNSDGPKQVKTPLCAPENFAGDGKICGEINLSWTDKTGETGYKIYRNLTDTNSTSTADLIVALGQDIVSYKDKSIIPRHTYYYLVTALTSSDESPPAKISSQTLCHKGAGWEEK